MGNASGWRGMLVVETIGRIRREHFVKGKSIKEIVRELKVSHFVLARPAGAVDFIGGDAQRRIRK